MLIVDPMCKSHVFELVERTKHLQTDDKFENFDFLFGLNDSKLATLI